MRFLLRPTFWLVLALVLRVAYLTESAHFALFSVQLLDEQENVSTAEDLLAGRGFGEEPLFKAPLYPILTAAVLAMFGNLWYWALRLIQHLLGVVLVYLAFDTTRRVAGGGRRAQFAGAVSAAFVAIHGPLIRLENSLILDFLFVFLTSATVWALVRSRTCFAGKTTRWIAAAGAFAALAWLTRPTLTPLLPFLAAWIAWPLRGADARRRLPRAGLFLAFPVAAMALVAVRNVSASGELMILPWQGGYNFYYANRPGASGRYLRQPEATVDATGNPTHRLAVQEFEAAVARNEVPAPPPNRRFKSVDAWWFARGRTVITEHPGAWFGLMARKTLYLVTDREIYNFEDYDVQRELSLVLKALPGRFGIVWPFALASLALLAHAPPARRRLETSLWLFAVLLAGSIALYYTSGRLRMPLVFPAAIFAGIGITRLAFSIRRHSPLPTPHSPLHDFRFPIPAYIVLLLVGAAMSLGDWFGVRTENVRYAEYLRLSNAAFYAQRYPEALDYARLAEIDHPGLTQAISLRAQATYGLALSKFDDERKKLFEQALVLFQDSAQAMPKDPVSANNAGIILLHELDRPRDALPWFNNALRRDPHYRRAAWEGALASLRIDDVAGAETLLGAEADPGGLAPLPQLRAACLLACARDNAVEARRIAQIIAGRFGYEETKWLQNELARQNRANCLQ